MAFLVVFQRRADADVRNQVAWLESTQGLRAADRWLTGFLAAVLTSLEDDPHRYPQADEATELGVNLRELLYGRRRQVHRVLFTIDGETVDVLRVRHATQDQLQPGDI